LRSASLRVIGALRPPWRAKRSLNSLPPTACPWRFFNLIIEYPLPERQQRKALLQRPARRPEPAHTRATHFL